MHYCIQGFVAPRVKDSDYNIEEEIRIIIPSQRPNLEVMLFLDQLRGTKILDINIEKMVQMVESEKQRTRNDDVRVYYRELFLPSNILSKIYIKDTSKMLDVKTILAHKGFGDREIVFI